MSEYDYDDLAFRSDQDAWEDERMDREYEARQDAAAEADYQFFVEQFAGHPTCGPDNPECEMEVETEDRYDGGVEYVAYCAEHGE